MPRLRRVILVLVGVLLALPLLAAALLIVAGNTGPGRHAIEGVVADLTGGAVRIDGLSGRFPDELRARQIILGDKAGTWLTVDRARLDWSPLRLVLGQLYVAKATAARVSMARSPEASNTSHGSTLAPASIVIDDLHIGRLDLAAPVAGTPASIAVDGDLHWAFPEQGSFTLAANRLDGAGTYRVSGTLTSSAISARLNVSEPAHGLLSGIAGLPDLGPLSVVADIEGPRSAERMKLTASAGPLRADANGTVDLVKRLLAIDVAAHAPAMAPGPELRWNAARLDIHLNGPLARPHASGDVDLEALQLATAAIGRLKATLNGSNGKLEVAAALSGLRLPGAPPDLFAGAPLLFHATALLDAAGRPVNFTLSHPLVTAAGQVDLDPMLAGSVAVTLPNLRPYAASTGLDLQGRARLNAKFSRNTEQATSISASGTIGITGGMPSAVAVIGNNATFSLAGGLQGQDVSIKKIELSGRAIEAAAHGSEKNGIVDFGWHARLSNLSALLSAMAGTIEAQGRFHGPLHDLAVTAQAKAEVAAAGSPRESLTASLEVRGLPRAPSGQLQIDGRLAGAPLKLAAQLDRESDGTFRFLLDRLAWKSASGSGDFKLAPGTSIPLGHLQLRMTHLDELAPLIAVKIAGSLSAGLDMVQVRGKPEAQFNADLRHLTFDGDRVDRLTAEARVADPMTRPVMTAALRATGIRHGALTGEASLNASGPPQSLRLDAASRLRTPQGPANVSAMAIATLAKRSLRLMSLQAGYGGETAHLVVPATIDFANGLAIEDFRLALGRAVIALAGRITPTLSLHLSARNITPALARPFMPDISGSGAIALDGQLRGKLAMPEGTLRLTGRKLEIARGGFGGLPPADIDATAVLNGSTARLAANLAAGTLRLRLAGVAPLQSSAPMALRLSGTTNLDLFNPILTPNGRAVRGVATLDLGVTGTMAQPQLTGTVKLANGAVEDFVQGVHVTDLHGLMRADGKTFEIVQLDGKAGGGTLSATGTIGILGAGMPMALTIRAHDAVLPASNLLTATTSGNINLRAASDGALTVGGQIQIDRANIRIPDRFPQSVAVLNVRRPGEKPPPSSPKKQTVALALAIAAPEKLFVRGHGLDAEMGGTLKIDGNAAAPLVTGGFNLLRGTFSFAGQILNLTSGKVSFGGTGLTNKIDPTIDFVAENTTGGVTAKLEITGYADAPKIKLSSTPELPQDEILAHLLFGQSAKQLSPFQLAEIAQAVASLSGVSTPNPVATVRKALGLDRLTVSTANGTPSAEAGKYIANGIYVGTKQGLSGGSQAQVQINLTKRLKLESTFGAGGTPATGATPNNDPGNSVGLSYQFEY